jgi:cytochrome P450
MSVRLDEIDLSSHDAFVEEVPLWAFRELRERDPVHWQPEPTPSQGFWAITRFRDIEEILRDTKTFSSAHGVTLEEQDDEEVEARASMIDMDPPNHSRLRRLVTKLFTRSAVAQYEGFVREPRASSTSSRRSRGSSRSASSRGSWASPTRISRCASSWATR